MSYKKGESGNKAGRPVGSGVAGVIRKAINDKAPELLQVVIDKALTEGDAQAALALLNKIVPNLKSASEPVKFNLDTSQGVAGVGSEIVQAISQGDVALDSGTQLLSGLASLAKLQESDELAKRITALEESKK
mgnify:CR=1 FL=1